MYSASGTQQPAAATSSHAQPTVDDDDSSDSDSSGHKSDSDGDDDEKGQNSNLVAHGVKWTPRSDGVTEEKDVSDKCFALRWQNDLDSSSKTPLDFFLLLFPMALLNAALTATNQARVVMSGGA